MAKKKNNAAEKPKTIRELIDAIISNSDLKDKKNAISMVVHRWLAAQSQWDNEQKWQVLNKIFHEYHLRFSKENDINYRVMIDAAVLEATKSLLEGKIITHKEYTEEVFNESRRVSHIGITNPEAILTDYKTNFYVRLLANIEELNENATVLDVFRLAASEKCQLDTPQYTQAFVKAKDNATDLFRRYLDTLTTSTEKPLPTQLREPLARSVVDYAIEKEKTLDANNKPITDKTQFRQFISVIVSQKPPITMQEAADLKAAIVNLLRKFPTSPSDIFAIIQQQNILFLDKAKWGRIFKACIYDAFEEQDKRQASDNGMLALLTTVRISELEENTQPLSWLLLGIIDADQRNNLYDLCQNEDRSLNKEKLIGNLKTILCNQGGKRTAAAKLFINISDLLHVSEANLSASKHQLARTKKMLDCIIDAYVQISQASGDATAKKRNLYARICKELEPNKANRKGNLPNNPLQKIAGRYLLLSARIFSEDPKSIKKIKLLLQKGETKRLTRIITRDIDIETTDIQGNNIPNLVMQADMLSPDEKGQLILTIAEQYGRAVLVRPNINNKFALEKIGKIADLTAAINKIIPSSNLHEAHEILTYANPKYLEIYLATLYNQFNAEELDHLATNQHLSQKNRDIVTSFAELKRALEENSYNTVIQYVILIISAYPTIIPTKNRSNKFVQDIRNLPLKTKRQLLQQAPTFLTPESVQKLRLVIGELPLPLVEEAVMPTLETTALSAPLPPSPPSSPAAGPEFSPASASISEQEGPPDIVLETPLPPQPKAKSLDVAPQQEDAPTLEATVLPPPPPPPADVTAAAPSPQQEDGPPLEAPPPPPPGNAQLLAIAKFPLPPLPIPSSDGKETEIQLPQPLADIIAAAPPLKQGDAPPPLDAAAFLLPPPFPIPSPDEFPSPSGEESATQLPLPPPSDDETPEADNALAIQLKKIRQATEYASDDDQDSDSDDESRGLLARDNRENPEKSTALRIKTSSQPLPSPTALTPDAIMAMSRLPCFQQPAAPTSSDSEGSSWTGSEEEKTPAIKLPEAVIKTIDAIVKTTDTTKIQPIVNSYEKLSPDDLLLVVQRLQSQKEITNKRTELYINKAIAALSAFAEIKKQDEKTPKTVTDLIDAFPDILKSEQFKEDVQCLFQEHETRTNIINLIKDKNKNPLFDLFGGGPYTPRGKKIIVAIVEAFPPGKKLASEYSEKLQEQDKRQQTLAQMEKAGIFETEASMHAFFAALPENQLIATGSFLLNVIAKKDWDNRLALTTKAYVHHVSSNIDASDDQQKQVEKLTRVCALFFNSSLPKGKKDCFHQAFHQQVKKSYEDKPSLKTQLTNSLDKAYHTALPQPPLEDANSLKIQLSTEAASAPEPNIVTTANRGTLDRKLISEIEKQDPTLKQPQLSSAERQLAEMASWSDREEVLRIAGDRTPEQLTSVFTLLGDTAPARINEFLQCFIPEETEDTAKQMQPLTQAYVRFLLAGTMASGITAVQGEINDFCAKARKTFEENKKTHSSFYNAVADVYVDRIQIALNSSPPDANEIRQKIAGFLTHIKFNRDDTKVKERFETTFRKLEDMSVPFIKNMRSLFVDQQKRETRIENALRSIFLNEPFDCDPHLLLAARYVIDAFIETTKTKNDKVYLLLRVLTLKFLDQDVIFLENLKAAIYSGDNSIRVLAADWMNKERPEDLPDYSHDDLTEKHSYRWDQKAIAQDVVDGIFDEVFAKQYVRDKNTSNLQKLLLKYYEIYLNFRPDIGQPWYTKRPMFSRYGLAVDSSDFLARLIDGSSVNFLVCLEAIAGIENNATKKILQKKALDQIDVDTCLACLGDNETLTSKQAKTDVKQLLLNTLPTHLRRFNKKYRPENENYHDWATDSLGKTVEVMKILMLEPNTGELKMRVLKDFDTECRNRLYPIYQPQRILGSFATLKGLESKSTTKLALIMAADKNYLPRQLLQLPALNEKEKTGLLDAIDQTNLTADYFTCIFNAAFDSEILGHFLPTITDQTKTMRKQAIAMRNNRAKIAAFLINYYLKKEPVSEDRILTILQGYLRAVSGAVSDNLSDTGVLQQTAALANFFLLLKTVCKIPKKDRHNLAEIICKQNNLNIIFGKGKVVAASIKARVDFIISFDFSQKPEKDTGLKEKITALWDAIPGDDEAKTKATNEIKKDFARTTFASAINEIATAIINEKNPPSNVPQSRKSKPALGDVPSHPPKPSKPPSSAPPSFSGAGSFFQRTNDTIQVERDDKRLTFSKTTYKAKNNGGDCGFGCLGITRESFVDIMEQNKSDRTIVSLLAPEVSEYVLQFVEENNKSQFKTHEAGDIGTAFIHFCFGVESKAEIAHFDNQELLKQKVTEFTNTEAAYTAYLFQYFQTGGYLQSDAMKCYAEITKTPISIIYLDKASSKYKISFTYSPENPKNPEIFMLHTSASLETHPNDFNHFVPLQLENSSPIQNPPPAPKT